MDTLSDSPGVAISFLQKTPSPSPSLPEGGQILSLPRIKCWPMASPALTIRSSPRADLPVPPWMSPGSDADFWPVPLRHLTLKTRTPRNVARFCRTCRATSSPSRLVTSTTHLRVLSIGVTSLKSQIHHAVSLPFPSLSKKPLLPKQSGMWKRRHSSQPPRVNNGIYGGQKETSWVGALSAHMRPSVGVILVYSFVFGLCGCGPKRAKSQDINLFTRCFWTERPVPKTELPSCVTTTSLTAMFPADHCF